MTSYVVPLLAIVALCAAWALFQKWLSDNDPDAERRSLKCGACSRKDDCHEQGQHQAGGVSPSSRSPGTQ